MSVPYTTNSVMLNSVSSTTTSNMFGVSSRSRLSIEMSGSSTATTATYTFLVSNDGTNFVAYNRATTNVTDDNAHNDTRVASVALSPSTTKAIAFFPVDDYFRYIKTTCTLTAGGAIVSSSISNPGSGYSVNDSLTIADGNNGTIKVLTVDGSGLVLTYSLTAAGTNYTVATHSSSGGAGTGFVLSVDSVNPGTFSATLQDHS